MRSLIVPIMLMTGACATHGDPKVSPSGYADASIVPVYVRNALHTPGTENRRTGKATAKYRACTGVYIAPHLVVTSIGVLPPAQNNAIVIVGVVDDHAEVVDVEDNGKLAIIRTVARGNPLPVRHLVAQRGEALTRKGFRFEESYTSRYALPKWTSGGVSVLRGANDSLLGTLDHFTVSASTTGFDCSSAIVDSEGNLVGITSFRHGNSASVMTVQYLLHAVHQLFP